MPDLLARRTGMMSALCSRLLIVAFAVAVMVVNTSGQNSSKKTPPKKGPAKPETPVAATPAQDAAPTIKFEKYTLPNGLVVILSEDHRLPFFFFQAEDGIRDLYVTGVQTCALPI